MSERTMHETAGRRAGPPPERLPETLIGPAADVVFVFGIGLLFSVALYLCWRLDGGFLVLAALFAVLLDFPHVLWTTVRVAFDPRERSLHGRHFLVSLAVIGAAVTGLAVADRFDVVLVVFVVWQVWHVVKQHIGMVTIYSARAGYRGSRRPMKWFLVSGCLAPVVYRASQGFHLGHYVINGHALPFSDVSLPLPELPVATVVLAYAVFAGSAVWFVTTTRRSGSRMPVMALVTAGVAILFYNLSYIAISDPYALILVATTFHALQYHVISWARNRGRFLGSVEEFEGPALTSGEILSRLTCPKSVVPLGLVLVVTGALVAQGEFVLSGVIPFTLVLHHFYLDGVLWKPARNPGLAGQLGLRKS